MKKVVSFAVLFCLLSTVLSAQDNEDGEEPTKGFDRSKLFGGGNFGLGFGSSNTFINISPQLGYRFTDHVAAGAGVNFIYNKVNFGGIEDKLGFAGLNVFGRLYPLKYIILHAQPELNYSWGKFKDLGNNITQKYEGKFIPSMLVGGGANIPTGGNGAFTIMYLYDLVDDARSPYSTNPFISFGFNFGF
ncbi:hypothetical protein [Parasegetibacter sp. NRK P23]|uniref:hypothetical protein n=1 Tax=Parasegetibacter sp. NRK P23 TaxID=2942999 RepID=UPI002044B581|nr:hypothetical protein [Parasegetibacter sp. NRK P23]MCM5529373.1 hypothetical protein [Parasegetibacter sp. NRK P23]